MANTRLDSPNNSLLQQQSVPNRLSSKSKTPVYANVYNFSSCFNCCCGWCGAGVYHTGIEVFNYEYMYYGFEGDESGVGYIQPKTAAYEFREQILLGYTEYTLYEIESQVLEPLHLEFIGNRYDLLQFNCNHFAKRLANMLQANSPFPDQAFSITNCLNHFRCCFPECILNGRLDWFNFQDTDSYQEVGESRHLSTHK